MHSTDTPRLLPALRQLYLTLSSKRRRQFAILLALMVAGAFAELVALGAVLPFLSVIASPDPANDNALVASFLTAVGAVGPQGRLLAVTALFISAILAAGAVRLLLAWISQKFVFALAHDLGVEIHRRTLRQPYLYHVGRNTSEIVASLEKVQVLLFQFLLPVTQAITALIISLFIIAALVYISPFAAFSAAGAFSLVYVIVSIFTRGRLARCSDTINSAYAQRVQAVQEALGGIRDIIIDQSQHLYLDQFRQIDRRFRRAQADAAFIAAGPRFVVETAGMVFIALLAFFIVGRSNGLTAAVPVLGALALGAQRLLPLLQQVYYGWASVAGGRAVVIDLVALLRLETAAEGAQARVEPLPLGKEIRFADVSFTYPGRSERVLRDVDLTIDKGSQVALIGKTGSGKSTLMDMLMGLLEPESGTLTVDGEPIRGLARKRWQASIAHVPQAIFLADTTIERNIAFGVAGGEINRQDVVDAARKAQLHDFVAGLQAGYDTMVGERGVRLSGGQRQRLGIARALYKRATVLILDEATSALDDDTEAAVMATLESLSEELTIVMIAHRLSTITGCDKVVRLDAGRVVEVGSYQDVVGVRGSELIN